MHAHDVVRVISKILGWENVPPFSTIEREIVMLVRARREQQAEVQHAGARVEQNDAADLESVSPERNGSRESVEPKSTASSAE
jgi:hypothetical protein